MVTVTVGVVAAQQALRRGAVHIQQADAAFACQLGDHRAGGADCDDDGVDLTGLELVGSVGIVQVDGVHQAVVQAVGRQDLKSILLGAGFLRADAHGFALQVLDGLDVRVGPHDDLTGLGVQGCYRAEVRGCPPPLQKCRSGCRRSCARSACAMASCRYSPVSRRRLAAEPAVVRSSMVPLEVSFSSAANCLPKLW